jgi:hypothetical protein
MHLSALARATFFAATRTPAAPTAASFAIVPTPSVPAGELPRARPRPAARHRLHQRYCPTSSANACTLPYRSVATRRIAFASTASRSPRSARASLTSSRTRVLAPGTSSRPTDSTSAAHDSRDSR